MANILIVDDESNLRRVLGGILRGAGHEAVEAAAWSERVPRWVAPFSIW